MIKTTGLSEAAIKTNMERKRCCLNDVKMEFFFCWKKKVERNDLNREEIGSGTFCRRVVALLFSGGTGFETTCSNVWDEMMLTSVLIVSG